MTINPYSPQIDVLKHNLTSLHASDVSAYLLEHDLSALEFTEADTEDTIWMWRREVNITGGVERRYWHKRTMAADADQVVREMQIGSRFQDPNPAPLKPVDEPIPEAEAEPEVEAAKKPTGGRKPKTDPK